MRLGRSSLFGYRLTARLALAAIASSRSFASLLTILCGSKGSYPQASAESRMALGLEC